ncbi:MAG: hypothetical protein RQ757_02685 [Pseudomonadales bacterium]|nr:hypothetical protein [Pseudomonadales bacterium]
MTISVIDRPGAGSVSGLRRLSGGVLVLALSLVLAACASSRESQLAAEQAAAEAQRVAEEQSRIAEIEAERRRQAELAQAEAEREAERAREIAARAQAQIEAEAAERARVAAEQQRQRALAEQRRQQEELVARQARLRTLEAEITRIEADIQARVQANARLAEAVTAAEELLQMLNTEQAKYEQTDANGLPVEPLQKAVIAELEARKNSLKAEAERLLPN